MDANNNWLVRPVQADDTEDIVALFERANVPCYCQYYQFADDHRQWQIRCASEPNQNRDALARDLVENQLHAVVARSPSQIIGWARVAPTQALGKLYDNRLYRALPVLQEGDRSRVFALSCFLVDPQWRRRGVARQLLDVCVELACELGASKLEAFPRGARDVSDGEQWTGPVDLYEAAGFRRIVDFAPYPVYQKELAPRG